MNPILYEATEKNFTSKGIGQLSDTLRCIVTEELNGEYELEMDYPVTGGHFDDLKEGRILYVRHSDQVDKQPFEIYKISKPLAGTVTVYAWHLTYRTKKQTCAPFSATSCAEAMSSLKASIIGGSDFTFTTDKSTVASFKTLVPSSVRGLFGGVRGSLLDVYGGEWEYDHFACRLLASRGSDQGVTIRYGKNLTDAKQTSDMSELWTGVVPYWSKSDAEVVYYMGDPILSSVAGQYAYQMIIPVDASEDFETMPTQAQLKTWGEAYVKNNAKSAVPSSIDVSFVALWQTEEYKDVAPLQRLSLGDTVTIYHKALGIDHKARIIKTTYNTLLERYDEMTVGEAKASLSSVIMGSVDQELKQLPSKSFMQAAIEKASELITGGLGGHVVIHKNADGQPDEILVMDTDDIATAVQVLRINVNGIGFSSTGYNGAYKSAWTLDNTFNADNVNVVNLSANSITAGLLQDKTKTNFWNLDTGELVTKQGYVGDWRIRDGYLVTYSDDGRYRVTLCRPTTSNGLTAMACQYAADGKNFNGNRFYVHADGQFGADSSDGDHFYVQDGIAYSKSSAGKYISLVKGYIDGGTGGSSYGYIDFSSSRDVTLSATGSRNVTIWAQGSGRIDFATGQYIHACCDGTGLHDYGAGSAPTIYLPSGIDQNTGTITGWYVARVQDGIVRF